MYAQLHAALWHGLHGEQRKYGADWLSAHLYCLMPRLTMTYDGRTTVLSYAKRLIAWTAPRALSREKAVLAIPADPGASDRKKLRTYSYLKSGAMDADAFSALIEQTQNEEMDDED